MKRVAVTAQLPHIAGMNEIASDTQAQTEADAEPAPGAPPALPKEIGGAPGPEPTRYGDWQYKGRCTDF